MIVQDLMVGERIGKTECQLNFLAHMNTESENDVLDFFNRYGKECQLMRPYRYG
jgi:hypothetical protein